MIIEFLEEFVQRADVPSTLSQRINVEGWDLTATGFNPTVNQWGFIYQRKF